MSDLERLVAEVQTGTRGYSEGDLRAVAGYLAAASTELEAEAQKLRDRNRVLAEAVVKQTNRIIELERAYEVLEGTYKRWRKEFYVADPWARLV